MTTFSLFQKVSLTLVTLNLAFTDVTAFAGSFYGSTFDPNKIDFGIPGRNYPYLRLPKWIRSRSCQRNQY
jgi:hypothetical protein